MPVLHRVFVSADQTRQRVGEPIRVPQLDTIGVETSLDRLADQPTVNRVRVAVDVDQAARIDPTPQAQTAIDPRGRQRAQRRQLLVEAVPATGVACGDQILKERDVLLTAREVATAPHQERLVECGLEVPVGRLVVAVLVGLTHVDPLSGQTVVFKQVPVACVELALGREVVDGRRQTVRAMTNGHAAEFPQGVLDAIGEGFERLRSAERDRLPVGITQHEVIHEVIERLPLDGDREAVHRGEVAGGQITGVVNLLELDVVCDSVRGLPLPDPALECASVGVVERTGMLGPDPRKERLGGESWLVDQPSGDRIPNVGKGIGTRAVGTRGLVDAGERATRPVLSRGLVVHVRPPGGGGEGRSAGKFAEQLAHLGIRDHRTPPRRGQELA